MMEPLVDTVQGDQVVSPPVELKVRLTVVEFIVSGVGLTRGFPRVESLSVRKPYGHQAVDIDVSSVKDVAVFKSDFELVMDRNDYVHALVRPVPARLVSTEAVEIRARHREESRCVPHGGVLREWCGGGLQVAYFDVEFSRCHKPISFSTSPHERGTHWKQTVFYLEDELVVCAGEVLKGTLDCKQNAKNPRDLDITITYSFNGKKCQAERTQRYMMR